MTEGNQKPDLPDASLAGALEKYLDGQLSDSEAESLADRMGEDALQAAVSQQQTIDNSLRSSFAPPPIDLAFLSKLQAEAGDDVVVVAPRMSARERQTRWAAVLLSVACVLAWILVGSGQLVELLTAPAPYGQRSIAQVYQSSVDSGFRPDWRCEDDQQFAQTFLDRQGQGLLLETLPQGVQMAGLAYLPGITEHATCMFARVDGVPVLVVVERSERLPDSLQQANSGDSLSVFTRQLEDLTLVEVTPLSEPRVLDFLQPGEVPAEPTGHVPGEPR